MRSSRVLILVEVAMMIALSFALSLITVFKMPQGGSVTAASMAPILLVGLRHGTGWGVTAGVAVGLLQMIFGGSVYHPIQGLLDYPVAFGVLGLSGLARGRSEMVGAVLGSLAIAGRFLAHVVSGVVFFAEYAPAGQNVWVYSAIYNGSFMLPELAISAVMLMVLLPVLRRVMPTAA